MDGVRVTGIDSQCSIKVLWNYFDRGRHAVKDIYYPLLNNDAVIIFKHETDTTSVLTSSHEKWKVLPLPNQVFRKQSAWVEKDLSVLVRATDAYFTSLRVRGNVDVTFDKTTQELILTGRVYQIEWAWNYLSSLQDNQFHIARSLQAGAKDSAAFKLSDLDSPVSVDVRRHEATGVSANRTASPRDVTGVSANRTASPHDVTGVSANRTASTRDVTGVSANRTASPHDVTGVSANRTASPRDVTGVSANRTASPHDVTDVSANRTASTRDVTGVSADRTASPYDVTGVSANRTASPRDVTGVSADHTVSKKTRSRSRGKTSEKCDHDDSIATRNKFASLPVNYPMSMSNEQPNHTHSAHSLVLNGSTYSGASAVNRNEAGQAEAAHRIERQFQSLKVMQDESFHKEEAIGPKSLPIEYRGLEKDSAADIRMRESHRSSYLPSQNSTSGVSLYTTSYDPSVEMSRKHFKIDKNLTLKIYVDDITKTKTEAVVNAANWELKNIGGVAGALAKAAGPQMADECDLLHRKHGALATAQVVKTGAYGKLGHLKCVIHTVGPIYSVTDTDRSVYELAQTFFNCLEFADKQHLNSLTFPFISTGIFGMPIEHCAMALITALKEFSALPHRQLQEIHFIHNDINVVCEAILIVGRLLETETRESTRRRMEDGERHFGHYVYPFCKSGSQQSSSQPHDDDRHALWDSTQKTAGTGSKDTSSSHHHHRQLRSDLSDDVLRSLQSDRLGSRSDFDHHSHGSRSSMAEYESYRKTAGRDDHQRSDFDHHSHGSRSYTSEYGSSKSSQKIAGRDPSPRPQARRRSNSFTTPGTLSSSSARRAGREDTGHVSKADHKPVIKPSLTNTSSRSSFTLKKF